MWISVNWLNLAFCHIISVLPWQNDFYFWVLFLQPGDNDSSLPCKVFGCVGFVRYLAVHVLRTMKYPDQLKTRQSELENASVSVFGAFY